jgi:3-methyladenine DNA glycosylase AlkD
MHSYLSSISQQFQQNAHEENAAGAKAYLLHQFEFYGLKTPLRRTLSKTHYKQFPVDSLKELETIAKECWALPQREYQYFAVELISHNKKLWKPSLIKTVEHLITHKSWWDSVDHIASEILSDYFKLFPEQIIPITSKWNKSDNMWLQRSSIMFQKAYKKNTDTELLSKYILHCKDSKEFFIRKAIGWALREYSKTNASWVKKFVKENKLNALSEREALKRINKS